MKHDKIKLPQFLVAKARSLEKSNYLNRTKYNPNINSKFNI